MMCDDFIDSSLLLLSPQHSTSGRKGRLPSLAADHIDLFVGELCPVTQGSVPRHAWYNRPKAGYAMRLLIDATHIAL